MTVGLLEDFHDFEPVQDDFLAAVLSGLTAPQKSLPSKFFYDERGSKLFDQICDLEEYYPTRTELDLLQNHSEEIARYVGSNSHLIEFGSGSSVKTRTLLKAMTDPLSYVPMDISREHLLHAATQLAKSFPDLPVIAICADYTSGFSFPDLGQGKRTGFFPGSTIGNFLPGDAEKFLAGAKDILQGGGMLIGVDLIKNEETLFAAYNDAKGITAEFNLNLLNRCNSELGANFNTQYFKHSAFYNSPESRIEMHLISMRDQIVSIAGHSIGFSDGESIHTENSCKYSVSGFQSLASRAGFTPTKVWVDPENLFSIHNLEA